MGSYTIRANIPVIERSESRVSHLFVQILDSLKDGDWHSNEEISRILCLPTKETDTILGFLSRFMFIESMGEKNLSRINPLIRDCWKKL